MRRVRSVLGWVVAVAAVLSVATPAGAASPSPGGVAGVPVPRLAWADCGDGFECATATVPRDYRDAAAGTFSLA